MKINHSYWNHHSKNSLMYVLCFALGGFVGCDLPERPQLVPIEGDLAKDSGDLVIDTEASEGPLDGEIKSIQNLGSQTKIRSVAREKQIRNVFEVPDEIHDQSWEAWEVSYSGDQPMGFNHIKVQPVDGINSQRMQYDFESFMHFQQGGAKTLQHFNLSSIETQTGKLLEFESTLQVGPVSTIHRGKTVNQVDGTEKLEIEMFRGSRTLTKSLTWVPAYRGMFAVEQSLRAKPLKKQGEKRLIAMLLPSHFGLAKAQLTCLGKTLCPLLDGQSAPLMEIENQVEREDGTVTTMFLWADDEGKVVRTLSPTLELNTYRVDEATAKKFAHESQGSVVLPIDGEIENPEKANRIAYEISLLDRYAHWNQSGSGQDNDKDQGGNPTKTQKLVDILPAPGQFVRLTSENKFQVVVTRGGEKTRKGFEMLRLDPTEEDTRQNHFMDYSDTLVRRFADAATLSTKGRSNTDVATTLSQTLKSLIQFEPTDIGLKQASIVARDGKGGETGQAILLAAMLRAKKIPARIAIGLKYEADPSQPGRDRLRDCVWVIFHAGDDWMHIDPLTGEFAPPDRIVLTTATLAGDQQDKVFVPLLDAVAKIQVRAIKAQYPPVPGLVN